MVLWETHTHSPEYGKVLILDNISYRYSTVVFVVRARVAFRRQFKQAVIMVRVVNIRRLMRPLGILFYTSNQKPVAKARVARAFFLQQAAARHVKLWRPFCISLGNV